MQTYNEIREKVKTMNSKCKCCKVCNGLACAGEVPGVGGKGNGRSFINNVEALKRVHIVLDAIMEDGVVSTKTTLLNQAVSMPILVAPIAGIQNNYGVEMSDLAYNEAAFEGAKRAGTFAFSGDGMHLEMFSEPLKAVAKFGGIPTIKPWIDEATNIRIDAALATPQVFGIATDIDAAGLPFLRQSATPVKNKSVADLRAMKERMKELPFIVKGVMSVQGALKALDAGADAIVISNHGGRVLDDCQGTMDVLPQIKAVVEDRMTILIDGGFHTGNDVFKALALGADGVLVGRHAILAAIANQADGVELALNQMKKELEEAMIMSGCRSIEEITAEKVVR